MPYLMLLLTGLAVQNAIIALCCEFPFFVLLLLEPSQVVLKIFKRLHWTYKSKWDNQRQQELSSLPHPTT